MAATNHIVVVGCWELPAAWNSKQASRKALKLWTHTIKAFSVNVLRLINGPACTDDEIDYRSVSSIDEVVKEFPDYELMQFEQGGKPLPESITKNTIFVFGSNYGELSVNEKTYELPTVRPLHAEMACAVALALLK